MPSFLPAAVPGAALAPNPEMAASNWLKAQAAATACSWGDALPCCLSKSSPSSCPRLRTVYLGLSSVRVSLGAGCRPANGTTCYYAIAVMGKASCRR